MTQLVCRSGFVACIGRLLTLIRYCESQERWLFDELSGIVGRVY